MAASEAPPISQVHSVDNEKAKQWLKSSEAKFDSVREPARTILEHYSEIPPDQILSHVKRVRDHAYAVFPYPCIELFAFVDLRISSSPKYPEILDRVKKGEKLLDLGCALGQEIRQLVFDGAPSENLYGSDLHYDFMVLGYELFRDSSRLKSTFIGADILEEDSSLLAQLAGQLHIIYTSLFFHLFDWNQQLQAIKHMLCLLKPQSGALITGRFVAYTDIDMAKLKLGAVLPFYHCLDSWKQLWEATQQSTRTALHVETWQEEDMLLTEMEIGAYMLCFAVYRK